MTTPTTPPRPTIATIMMRDWGAEALDQLVSLPAAELFEWAWLTAQLGDWLHDAGEPIRREFHHRFGQFRGPEPTAAALTQISERIAALLDGDRRQP
jgi:hypothetical protein